jgi:ribonuclease D
MPDLAENLIFQPEELARCCEQLAAAKRFGLDTEFVGEESYHPKLCLVQVATAEALYLIDPFTVGPLDAFWKVVVDPANQVVVHAGREEVRLCHLWSGQVPGNLFDLQIAAGLVGLSYPLSHGNLVSQVLGVQLAKAETLTEWRNRPLTRPQIRYALDDVRFLLPIWDNLSKRLEKLERTAWAEEEFARLTALATPEEPGLAPGADRWRKLRGIGTLDRRRLAIVRALFSWREELAAQNNRPARSIVRDDLLIEIARRNPTRERDLQVMRGLPKRHLEGIVQAVARARALPPEQLPVATERDLDPPQAALLVNVLSAVLGDFCARHHLAPNLTATSQDLKLLVRARLQGAKPPVDSLLTRGWRAVHILPVLQAVLEGRRSLRIADVDADAPFTYADVEE